MTVGAPTGRVEIFVFGSSAYISEKFQQYGRRERRARACVLFISMLASDRTSSAAWPRSTVSLLKGGGGAQAFFITSNHARKAPISTLSFCEGKAAPKSLGSLHTPLKTTSCRCGVSGAPCYLLLKREKCPKGVFGTSWTLERFRCSQRAICFSKRLSRSAGSWAHRRFRVWGLGFRAMEHRPPCC